MCDLPLQLSWPCFNVWSPVIKHPGHVRLCDPPVSSILVMFQCLISRYQASRPCFNVWSPGIKYSDPNQCLLLIKHCRRAAAPHPVVITTQEACAGWMSLKSLIKSYVDYIYSAWTSQLIIRSTAGNRVIAFRHHDLTGDCCRVHASQVHDTNESQTIFLNPEIWYCN